MQNNNEPLQEETQDNKSEQETINPLQNFSAMPAPKKAAVLGGIIVMLLISVYIVFFSGNNNNTKNQSDKVNSDKQQNGQQIEKPTHEPIKDDIYRETEIASQKESEQNNIEQKMVELKPPKPPVLEAPKVESEPAPPPLPEPKAKPELPKIPIEKNEGKEDTQQAISSTSIMAFGGAANNKEKDPTQKTSHINNQEEDFLGFDGGTMDGMVLKNTSAKNVVATKINSDLRYSIIQGKVIEGVLETAINTQLDVGVIRALVSHDVYAEQGDLVLIPKGSRLIGKYSKSQSGSDAGVITRVYAAWERIITPGGVDINLPKDDNGSIAVDPLGRSGIPGYVDTNISNTLTNALLVSVLGPYIIAKATGIDKETVTKQTPVPTPDGSNTNPNANTVTVSSAGTQIISDGINKFQGIAADQINKQFPPNVINIFVDQGTRVNIIARQDIVFPKQAITSNHAALP